MLDQLRKDTRPLHDQVEQAMASSRIMNDDFTIKEYEQLLQKLYVAHSALEPVLLSFGELVSHPKLEATYRLNKRKAIEKDLSLLKVAPGDSRISEPVIHNIVEAWGALYVLEGSTLGGAMILKQLTENPNLHLKDFNFYGYYGSKTGSMWKQFKTSLIKALAERPDTYPDLLRGANTAYSTFIKAAQTTQDVVLL